MKKILLASVALLGFASAASAADLPSRRAPAPAPIIAAVPVFTWTGFYAGVNAGYGWNTNDNNVIVNGVAISSNNDGGFVGGGQIGYNYQIGSFVVGVETDLQYADIGGGRQFYSATLARSGSDNYFGTVRARAGVAFDRALVYATGGFAYGDVGGVLYNPSLGYYAKNDTNTGWTLGGGVEYAFTNNLSAKVEGLYVNLDTKNDPLTYTSSNNEFGVVRAGLNYKFGSY